MDASHPLTSASSTFSTFLASLLNRLKESSAKLRVSSNPVGFMERHNDAVAAIADRVRYYYEHNVPFRIYHGSTNSTRKSQFQRNAIVDTSQLSHVLKVDSSKKTALVEPNVPMDALVAATLQHGLVPPVIMEFPGITTGGGFAGTSGESSSFRHGLFEDTVASIEVVLANGEVVTASGVERPDLFYGSASSYGTLGVTTLLEIRLIEAKTYVELTYYPISSVSEALQKIEDTTKDTSCDYIDGILFAKDRGVICIGHLTNVIRDGITSQRFSRAQDPWFYCHAELRARSAHPTTEAIPLVDYLFRYDRGAFWGGRYAFRYFITPFNRFTRWALDRFMHTRIMYHALHTSTLAKRYIVQDVAVPYTAADEFLQFLDKDFGFYPLWLCPLRLTSQSRESPYHAYPKLDALLNFGIWGPGPTDIDEFVRANRRIEQKVHGLGGKKALYAHAYYTEGEFWKIYDKEKYDALRSKYNATYLPSIYDKVKVDVVSEKEEMNESWMAWLFALFWSIWPLCGLYGVFHVIIKSDYLLPRNSQGKHKSKVED